MKNFLVFKNKNDTWLPFGLRGTPFLRTAKLVQRVRRSFLSFLPKSTVPIPRKEQATLETVRLRAKLVCIPLSFDPFCCKADTSTIADSQREYAWKHSTKMNHVLSCPFLLRRTGIAKLLRTSFAQEPRHYILCNSYLQSTRKALRRKNRKGVRR